MICIIALVVCGVLGIFSIKYRIIAKEALDCVFRRITLRKCDTGLDQRLKSQITGNLMRRHYGIGSWTFKHFEIISWFFTIMMVVSLGYSAYGGYNYIKYGNCNGKDSTAFCIFDPFGNNRANNTPVNDLSCHTGTDANADKILLPPSIYDEPFLGPDNASVLLIEVGCFQCPATKQVQPVIKQISSEYNGKIKIVWIDLPIAAIHEYSKLSAEAAECAREQGKFWEYGDVLFENQKQSSPDDFKKYAADLDLNTSQFAECLDTGKYRANVEADLNQSIALGYYGTPTIFVNNQFFVGPQDYTTIKKAIDEELAKV